MTDMVERAAKAAFEAMDGTMYVKTPWDSRIAETQENYRRMVRAVIKAMREPTEEMMDAGGDAWDWFNDTRNAADAWRAMIDAALEKERA